MQSPPFFDFYFSHENAPQKWVGRFSRSVSQSTRFFGKGSTFCWTLFYINWVRESRSPSSPTFTLKAKVPVKLIAFSTQSDRRKAPKNHLYETGVGVSIGDIISILERPLPSETLRVIIFSPKQFDVHSRTLVANNEWSIDGWRQFFRMWPVVTGNRSAVTRQSKRMINLYAIWSMKQRSWKFEHRVWWNTTYNGLMRSFTC